jgi:hypothetical protein
VRPTWRWAGERGKMAVVTRADVVAERAWLEV